MKEKKQKTALLTFDLEEFVAPKEQGIPVPDEDLDLSDDFFDTLKMEEGHQE